MDGDSREQSEWSSHAHQIPLYCVSFSRDPDKMKSQRKTYPGNKRSRRVVQVIKTVTSRLNTSARVMLALILIAGLAVVAVSSYYYWKSIWLI